MTNPSFDFEREARRLGQQAGDAIDPERMADQVLNRLRRRVPWWRSSALLRAAAVVLLVGSGFALERVTFHRGAETPAAPQPAHVSGGLLEGLSPSELSEVLDSEALDTPASMLTTRGLHDLSEAQLRELLRMES